jgi:16S rRNA processing protein RimM
MHKKDCFLVGTVFKLHGYKGDVNIYNEDNIPFDFSILKYFLIEKNNELIPFFVEWVRPTKPNVLLVKFEDVNSEEEAKKIHKRKIYLPKNWLPKKEKNEISKKQLIGYSIIDIEMGELGKISFINSKTTQTLIYVSKDGEEFCFPWHKQFVKNIDTKQKIMEVEIPKEFLDLN